MSPSRLSAQDLDLALAELAELDDLEEVLRRHPLQQRDLEPLLHAAARTRTHLSKVPPPPHGLQDGRRRLLAEAAKMRTTQVRSLDLLQGLRSFWGWPWRLSPPLRVAVVVLVVLVKLSSLSGGVVLAAEQSLPGGFLYPVKETMEDVRLSVARDPASLTLFYTERRLRDIGEAVQRGRTIPEPTVHRLEWQFLYLIERARIEADSADPAREGGLAMQLRGQVERLDAIAAQMEGAAQQHLLVEAKERFSRELDHAEGMTDHEPSPPPLVDDSHSAPPPDEHKVEEERPASRPDPTPTPLVEQPQDRDGRRNGDTADQPAPPTVVPARTDIVDRSQDDQATTEDVRPITPDKESEEPAGRPTMLPSKAAPAVQDAILGPDSTPGLPPKQTPPGRLQPSQPERPQTPIPPPSQTKPSGDDEGDQSPALPTALPSKEVPPGPLEKSQPEDKGISPEPSATRDVPSDGEDGNQAPVEPPALPSKEVPPGSLQKPRPTETPQP